MALYKSVYYLYYYRVETNGQTDGRTRSTALSFPLTWSVSRAEIVRAEVAMTDREIVGFLIECCHWEQVRRFEPHSDVVVVSAATNPSPSSSSARDAMPARY